MRPIAEIAKLFAEIDGAPEERIAQIDKALRNLTQRHFMPPDGQEGRAHLYGRESAVVIRLVSIASAFGLGRLELDAINNWLRGVAPTLPDDPNRTAPRFHDAIANVEAGEDFAIQFVMDAAGNTRCEADWPKRTKSTRAQRTLELAYGDRPEIARFSIPASRVIRDLRAAWG